MADARRGLVLLGTSRLGPHEHHRPRTSNHPLLAAEGEDAFVDRLLGSLGSFPAYFRRLGELNRRGPAVLPEPLTLNQLEVSQVQRLMTDGATVVDVRPIADYGTAHVPGSLSIELRDAFATWLGWLVLANRPVVVLRNRDQDSGEVLAQAAKIGFDDLAGELAGGLPAWRSAGLPVTATPIVGLDRIEENVLDIRQTAEFNCGHVPGAQHIELGGLATAAGVTDQRSITVMCGHGERAMTAASILEQAARHDVSVLAGGPRDWAAAHNLSLESGP